MRILFTVCGRAGSKGIKGKNFKKFLGIPLLYYTFAAINLYQKNHPENIVEVALNTDSDEMIELTNKTKLDISIVHRKENLAGDFVAKIDVIADTFKEISAKTNYEFDMVIDCDITSPLRTVKDIENLIKKHSDGKWDIVYSVTTARRNPYFNIVTVDETGQSRVVIKSDYVARQQAPAVYDMNASLYAYKPAFLKEGKQAKDAFSSVIHMLDTAVLDLDNAGDFELMQVIADYLFKTKEEFYEVYAASKCI